MAPLRPRQRTSLCPLGNLLRLPSQQDFEQAGQGVCCVVCCVLSGRTASECAAAAQSMPSITHMMQGTECAA